MSFFDFSQDVINGSSIILGKPMAWAAHTEASIHPFQLVSFHDVAHYQ